MLPDTKVRPRPAGLLLQENLENQRYEEKQMTAIFTGASSANDQWSSINWKEIESQVRRLQMRIAKAMMWSSNLIHTS